MRGFHKFLYAEGAAETDPSAPVSGPRKGRPLPKVLSVAEVDRLLAGAQQAAALPDQAPAPPAGAADGLPARTALRHGPARLGLVALPRTAASIDARLLVVKGKGGRERMVPLTETARAAMAAHLPSVPEDSPWLFPADSESGHMTGQAFARDLKDAASAAGPARGQG